MIQILVIEVTENAFQKAVDKKLKEGFKVIAGSTYIKSLQSDIVLDSGVLLDDIDHVLTVSITGEHDFMIYAKDISTFRKEVNSKLEKSAYNIVIGSLSIDLVRLDNYTRCTRAQTTYYSCALYKE